MYVLKTEETRTDKDGSLTVEVDCVVGPSPAAAPAAATAPRRAVVRDRRGRPDVGGVPAAPAAARRPRGDGGGGVGGGHRVVHGSVPGVGGGGALVVRGGVRRVGGGGALLDEARARRRRAEVVLRRQRVVGRRGQRQRLLGALLQAADHVTGEVGR